MPKPYLPQNDPKKEERTNGLEDYQYDYEYLPPLALLKEVPTVENFSARYIAERVIATAELVPNMLAAKVKSFLDPLDALQDYEDFFTVLPLPEVAKVYETNNSFAEQRLSGANPMVICRLKEGDARAEVLKQIPSWSKEFEPLFQVPEELAAGNIYVTDYTGTDPNYRGPAKVQGGTHEKGRKYLPKPLAFFWWRSIGTSDRGKLVPIAIQLDANTNPIDPQPDSIELDPDPIEPDSAPTVHNYRVSGNKVYTPFEKNPLDWLFAKFCVQIADANHHEMSTHLCRTHFVMSPFAVATARQLAENHPLSILLKPHFLFMLANNHLGQQALINAGGYVDRLLAGNLAESMELVKDAYEGWNINDFALPKELEKRGMKDSENSKDSKDNKDSKDSKAMKQIPHYPYRDDGMLVWDAIHTFVTDYLNHFYKPPQELANDTELQAWAAELSNETTGGKVKGMPSKIDTVTDLIEIITTVIFTCGPQHSAVNFPQYEYMALGSNMPLAGYQDIPDENPDVEDPMTMKKILDLLPPYKKSAEQLEILDVLTAYKYDRLGYYEQALGELYNQRVDDIFYDAPPIEDRENNPDGDIFKNQAIRDIIRTFQQNLNIVEQKIDANNKKRVVAYPYLKPSLILNSISI
jgi:arachidonate 15-lipoxygenase